MDITSQSQRQSGPPDLRAYQLQFIDDVENAFATGHRRVVGVMPTGSGKTVVASEIVRRATASGRRSLFLCHRRELVAQSSRKLHAAGVDHGIIAAGFPTRPREPVQVGMVPTIHARAVRVSSISLPPADLVLVDEAHHVVADTWRKIVDRYPKAVVVGFTATPVRADNRGLGGVFDVMVEGPSIAALIAAGHLVRTKVYAPSTPDLEGVRITAGDYNEAQLAERMDKPELVGDVVTHWHRLAERRPTVVFATNIRHSVHLRDEFLRSGVTAKHLDGGTPADERDAVLARLARGVTEVVCNVGVLVEGWDNPKVSCLVLAKPTRSLGAYLQAVGRGLRPSTGKVDCLILDHAAATVRHGFVDDDAIPWSLAPDRPVSRSSSSSGTSAARKLAVCPECTAVYWTGRPCTACGWRPRPRPQAIQVRDGELAELGRDRTARRIDPSEAERRDWHGMLATIATEKGYASGWVAHKYKDRFGAWPLSRHPAPTEPTPEVRSWVRSRTIAWAKSQARVDAR